MNKIANKLLKELSYQTGKYLVPPEFLSLIVTMKCNFKCLSCSIWQKAPEAELGEAEWGKIVDKLKGSLKPETFVEINGGEPLIRKDLTIFLIKELKKYFKRVALNSNGLLIDEKNLAELRAAGLDIVKISLYSLNKETHNNLRGHVSAFEQAKKALELINKKNIALEVGLLLTAQNIKEAPELIEYLQTLPNTSIILQPLDEKVESAESKNLAVNNPPLALWPMKEDVNAFFDWVMSNRAGIKNSQANLEAIKKYYLEPKDILQYRCFAGQRNLVIYPNGGAALCFKGAEIGNLVKDDLKAVLKKAEGERKKIKKCPKYCRIVGCNFSRGLKEALKDKFLKKQ